MTRNRKHGPRTTPSLLPGTHQLVGSLEAHSQQRTPLMDLLETLIHTFHCVEGAVAVSAKYNIVVRAFEQLVGQLPTYTKHSIAHCFPSSDLVLGDGGS